MKWNVPYLLIILCYLYLTKIMTHLVIPLNTLVLLSHTFCDHRKEMQLCLFYTKKILNSIEECSLQFVTQILITNHT
jgi:hypothetical protein